LRTVISKTVADLIFRSTFLVILFGCLSLIADTQERFALSNCEAPNHDAWTVLLRKNVAENGWVNYSQFVKDSVLLNEYLNQLSACQPNEKWTKDERLAYWINVYNAFTVKLIVDNYPVNSIKDIKKGIPLINSVWEMDFFEIGGKSFDLSTVEHQILRKDFDEPRIHFAIVCASKSCPQLLNEAYRANHLDEQLTAQTRRFLADSSKNVFGQGSMRISPIFKWFRKDFTQNGSLQEFISNYTDAPVSSSTGIEYTDYDWTLNGE
jgi:hypothetical protein